MFLRVLILAALARCVVFAIGEQLILEDGSNGTAAVLFAVARVWESSIFPNDNDLLRRIAYVETKDGSREN